MDKGVVGQLRHSEGMMIEVNDVQDVTDMTAVATAAAVAEQEEEGQKEEEEGWRKMPLIRPLVEVEGVPLPPMFKLTAKRPLSEHVRLLAGLQMRHDDVIVMAYPKSGTHWTWEVVNMLMSRKAELEPRAKICLMLEAASIEALEAEPSPRVLNTHLPPRLLPRQVKDTGVKVVHVRRNVKDVLVSAYFHYRQVPRAEGLTLDGLEKAFLLGKGFSLEFFPLARVIAPLFNDKIPVPFGGYVNYMKEMEEFRRNNPDMAIFNMSYEDMKEDPEGMIRSLAQFLGHQSPHELSKEIAEATGFQKMKEAERHKKLPVVPFMEVYRKGEVGDWKNHMTVAQSERLDAAMTLLKSCDYHFRYEL